MNNEEYLEEYLELCGRMAKEARKRKRIKAIKSYLLQHGPYILLTIISIILTAAIAL